MAKHRIVYLDLVKLFTIYLVILGHVIAMMVNGYTVGGRLYSLIYSFHMPLFMLLSGYFVSSSTLNKPFGEFLFAKVQQLLLPAITCTLIVCVYLYIFRGTVDYRTEVIGNSWFLKTLFVYYVLFYLLKRIEANDWVLFVLSCVILFLIPHGSTLQINLLFPYFWGGHLLRKYEVLDKIMPSRKFALVFLVVFVGSYSLQRYLAIPNYIPINYETIRSQWHLILFRYIVGFSGCMSTISIISALYERLARKPIVSRIAKYGQWTLGVYVLQTILVANVFPDTLAWYVESEFLLDVIVAPAIASAFLVICLWLIRVLSRNRIVDLLLFGGQYYSN